MDTLLIAFIGGILGAMCGASILLARYAILLRYRASGRAYVSVNLDDAVADAGTSSSGHAPVKIVVSHSTAESREIEIGGPQN